MKEFFIFGIMDLVVVYSSLSDDYFGGTECILLCLSVKSPKENDWILDPVVIADIYGLEVLFIFSKAWLTVTLNKFYCL